MRKSDTSRLVDADAEIAALGTATFVGLTNRQAALALPNRMPISAMAAGVALHDSAHFGVGVFLDVEQGVFHGHSSGCLASQS